MSGHRIKTKLTLFITVLTLALLSNAPAHAADDTNKSSEPSKSEGYLKEIRDTLLLNINKLPVYLNQLTKMAMSWLAPDDSSSTAALQNSFTTLANAHTATAKTQEESQNQYLGAFLSKAPKNVAEITYQTLLKLPTSSTPPSDFSSFSYTLNASGLNIQHTPPQVFWKDSPSTVLYKNYYNTASAVQTYNGYILSELYASSKNNNQIKQIQDSLIQQASKSDWFTQIASENLGVVLRQILLYNSQTYVLLTELLQTQKKILAAQAMNNALLIAVNQESENRLYSKAAGVKPE